MKYYTKLQNYITSRSILREMDVNYLLLLMTVYLGAFTIAAIIGNLK